MIGCTLAAPTGQHCIAVGGGGSGQPLRLEAFALSPREREVAALIAQDLDTAAIAARLFISPWTVQDHCKAIFEKTGTRSRRELRALVFFQDHLPAIMVRTPLDAGGHLDVEPSA